KFQRQYLDDRELLKAPSSPAIRLLVNLVDIRSAIHDEVLHNPIGAVFREKTIERQHFGPEYGALFVGLLTRRTRFSRFGNSARSGHHPVVFYSRLGP